MSLPNPAELLPQMAAALTSHLNQRQISDPRFIGIRTGGVWVARALRAFYFPGRHVTDRELIGFTESHFGPEAGYAQQYLFHYARRNPHLVKTASESDDEH